MNNTKPTILVIEGKPDKLITLTSQIRKLFPKAAIFVTSDELRGLDLAGTEDPDVVILDMDLPGSGSLAVCKKMKADLSLQDIPVLFTTTSREHQEKRLSALEAGAEAFLALPLDETALLVQIRLMAKIKEANLFKREKASKTKSFQEPRPLGPVHSKKPSENTGTENQDIEKTLLSSEKIFRYSIDMLCIAGFDGYFKVLNPAWSKTLGWTTEELLSRPWNDFVHPDDLQATNEIKSVIVDGQQVYQFENKYICKDGSIKWLSWNSFPFPEEGIMFGVARDITLQRKSEKDYQSLFNEAMDGIAVHQMIYDAEGRPADYRFLAVNPAYERLTGLKAAQVIGRSVLEVLPSTEPYWIETYGKVARGGEPENFENYAVNLQKWFEVKAFSPAPDQFVSIFSDITKRKNTEKALRASEEKYRTLFNNSAIAIAIRDTDGSMTEFNEAYQRILGYSADELRMLKTKDITHHDDIHISADNMQSILDGQAEMRTYEKRYYHKDGHVIWANVCIQALKDSHKRVTAIMGSVSDITTRVLAELAMKESESKLRLFIEHAPANLAMLDRDLRYIAYSNRMLEDSRIEKKDLHGLKHYDIFPEISPGWRDIHQRALQGEVLREDEDRFERLDGSVQWLAWEVRPWKDAQGNIGGIVIFSEDISGRKHAEEALHKSHELLEKLARLVPGVIYQYRLFPDGHSCFPYASPGIKEIYGVEPWEVKEDASPVFSRLHPEDYDYIVGSIQESAQDLSLYHSEYRVVLPGQEEGWRMCDARPERLDDGSTLWHGIITDITSRKKADTIRQIQYNIAKSVLLADNFGQLHGVIKQELGRVLDTSRFSMALYHPENEALVSVVSRGNIDHLNERPFPRMLAQKVVQGQNTLLLNKETLEPYARENKLDLQGGPLACWLGVPIGLRGKVAGIMVLQSDTNSKAFQEDEAALLEAVANETSIFLERQRILDDLIKAKEEAEEGDKLKTAFIQNISHEIRTPMNSILGFGQYLVQDGLSSEKRLQYYTSVEESSNRLMQTITDYIDMAMIAAGSLKANKEDFLLGPLITTVFDDTKTRCREKKLECSLSLPDMQGEFIVHTDRELLQKVLHKLIDNAFKFTDHGKISLGYQVLSDHLEFRVEDTGKGIAKEKLTAIFDMFTQQDSSMTRGHEGSGLGLTIAKGMVELLGGEILVKSVQGKGSVFSFTLPNEKNAVKTIAVAPPRVHPAGSGKPVVLVAEDEESNYLLMEVIVEKAGCEFLHAMNGLEAVELCKARPDISFVLMDIKMPVMNGLEATRLIRDFRPNLPIFAITAYAQTGDEQRMLAGGCDAYFAKPIRPDLLENIIKKYSGK